MHAIHHTEAIVLKSTTHGEANKRVWLFTREFGLVVASVQGVRKQESKLASQITDYALIHADVVRGREVWRLVSATKEIDSAYSQTRNPLTRVFVRTLAAVSRFIVDEDSNEPLFEHLIAVLAMTQQGGYDAKKLDAVSLWKVFVHLGYIADEKNGLRTLEEIYAAMDDGAVIKMNEAVKSAIEQSHL